METVTATYWVAMYDTGQDADYVLFENEQDALGWCEETARAPYIAHHMADGDYIEISVFRQELPVNVWERDGWSWWNVQRSAVRVHVVALIERVAQFTLANPAGGNRAGVELRHVLDNNGERWRSVWGDYVANEWAEEFGTFSEALARCAVLAYCAQHDWERGFKRDPGPDFSASVCTFLDSETV